MKLHFPNLIDKAKFIQVCACELLHDMALLDAFWAGIPDSKKFDYTDVTTPELKKIMRVWLTSQHFQIGFYHSSWFYRGVVAHVNNNNPRHLMFNTRHFDFIQLKGETLEDDIRDKIETSAHEIVHVADNFTGANFGHGNNDSQGKENSFPYWFGKYAAKFFKGDYHINLKTIRGSY